MFESRARSSRNPTGHILRVGLFVAVAMTAACGGAATGSGSGSTAAGGGSQPGGSGSAGGPTTPADQACTIVSQADVSAVVGFPITTVGGAAGTCVFQGADKSKAFYVLIYPSQAAMQVQTQLKASGENIDGLGDEAFWIYANADLFVRKGDRALSFNYLDWVMDKDNSDAHRDAMVGLAKKALAKL